MIWEKVMRRVCKYYRLQRSPPRKFGYITENGLPHFMCRRGEVGVFVRVCDRTYSYSVQPTNQRRRSLGERVYRKFVWNEARETADGMESMAGSRSVTPFALSPFPFRILRASRFYFFSGHEDTTSVCSPSRSPTPKEAMWYPFIKMLCRRVVVFIIRGKKTCISLSIFMLQHIQRGTTRSTVFAHAAN